MKNLCRFFLKMLTLSFIMLVFIARFKAEKCRNRYFKIVSSGESLFSLIRHSLCSMQHIIYQLYCSEKTLFINVIIQNLSTFCLLYFKEGSSLPLEEIISSHIVERPVHVNCNFLCFNDNVSKCVGFNFRAKTKAINCQLTNTTKKRNDTEEGEWTLYWDVDAVRIQLKMFAGYLYIYIYCMFGNCPS